MAISLQTINSSNYEAVCDLELSAEQQDFMASNMFSLVEAAYNTGYCCRAIYLAEQLVGFFMWVAEKQHKVSIWRFMVDKNYQHQGIGRAALALAITEILACAEVTEIEICYDPSNIVARDFYASFGFVETGLDPEGEDMLAVIRR